MKKLKKYFEQQHDLALKNLELAQAIFSEKPLHELRVSIKRIKALFDFLAELLPKETEISHYFKPFKEIFRVAGKLRDAQVQERLLLKCAKDWNLPAPLAYETHLKKIQNIAFHKFKKTAQHVKLGDIKSEKRTLKKILDAISEETLPIDTESLLRYRFANVRLLVQEPTEEDSLHEARKMIKSIYYVLHLVFAPTTPQQYQDLKHLEEVIGDWHDLAILSDNMRHELRTHTDQATVAFLTRLAYEKECLQQKIPPLVQQELRCWKLLGKLKF